MKIEMKKGKTIEQSTLIKDALDIISSFGIPIEKETERMKEKMALNFLTLTDIKVGGKWSDAKDVTEIQLKTRDIIRYVNEHFNENRSSGSYDDVRRRELKPLVLAKIIVNSKPDSAHNDSTRGYGVATDYCKVVRLYKTDSWKKALVNIVREKGRFSDRIDPRKVKKVEIDIPDRDHVYLSLGEHNILQKKIIEDMMPVFCSGSEILYLGDTAKKQVINNEDKLNTLNFFELKHGMLPDIVAYSQKQNWLYLIEAVYTSNPISNNRKIELKDITKDCKAKIIFISAFLNRTDFRKYVSCIAWETEVWLADEPNHMIHFNGDKIQTPYDS